MKQMKTPMERARAYISAMPPSIQGQGGDQALFAVAVVLRKNFALSEADALILIQEFNQRSVPAWGDRDLLAKLHSAAALPGPVGKLLDRGAFASQNSSLPHLAEARIDKSPAERRADWPKLQRLSPEAQQVIAIQRRVSPLAVNLLASNGFICEAFYGGHRCYVLTEGAFAQARRLDGGELITRSGTKKAKNLAGSEGAFIGQSWLGGKSCPVLLVEGCIGMLEAAAAALAVDADSRGWTVLAATSAGSRFEHPATALSGLLQTLAGRRIRILSDNDVAGREACTLWTRSLRAMGCTVDAELPPDGLKDLGPVVADPTSYTSFLTTLFTL